MSYREKILDHYHRPRRNRRPDRVTHKAEGLNTSCGDRVDIFLSVKDGVFSDIGFRGEGCAISQAAASILCEYLLGKKAEDLRKMTKDDMLTLLEAPLSPARARCGLLAWETAKRALETGEKKNRSGGRKLNANRPMPFLTKPTNEVNSIKFSK